MTGRVFVSHPLPIRQKDYGQARRATANSATRSADVAASSRIIAGQMTTSIVPITMGGHGFVTAIGVVNAAPVGTCPFKAKTAD